MYFSPDIIEMNNSFVQLGVHLFAWCDQLRMSEKVKIILLKNTDK